MTDVDVAVGPRRSVHSDAIRWFSHERRRRRARALKWRAIAGYLIVVGGVGILPAFGWYALLAALLALVAWLVELWSGPECFTEGKSEPGSLLVEDGKLRVESAAGTESIDPKQVQAGWVEEPDHMVLELRDGRSVSAHVSDRDARKAFMNALGVGAADRVLRVPIYSRLGTLPAGEMFAVLAAVFVLPAAAGLWTAASVMVWQTIVAALHQGFVATLMPLLYLAPFAAGATFLWWLLLGTFKKRNAVVGTDGIVVEGAWRKVIPFSEIKDVTLSGKGASVHCRDGKIVSLPTGRADPLYPTAQTDEEAARARRLVERAREAMSAAGTSAGLDQKATWLESGGRSLDAWRENLRQLGERVGDYRRPGIDNDELLAIARDAARSGEQRAGAMFLIGQRGADGQLAEATLAACADPRLAELLREALRGRLDEGVRGLTGAPARLRVENVDAAQPPEDTIIDVELEDAPPARAEREASD